MSNTLRTVPRTNNALVDALRDHMNQRIVGQATFVDSLLLGLFGDGHILLEGAPGLAKTKAVNTLAELIEGEPCRVQFTPDLLPSDLTGTEIYRPEKATFEFHPGPLFHNLILADEINRAPAKVQSALLEAMAERQVTVAKPILEDTGSFRAQISPQPEADRAVVTTGPFIQAAILNFGGKAGRGLKTEIPARPYFGFGDGDIEELIELAEAFFMP